MEVARLRAQQEKMADHQSELDELRAKRYQVGRHREVTRWHTVELGQQQLSASSGTCLPHTDSESLLEFPGRCARHSFATALQQYSLSRDLMQSCSKPIPPQPPPSIAGCT